MSPRLTRYLAFSGKASGALSVRRCAAAIAERLWPALTFTVVIGCRRIALARVMTRLTRAPLWPAATSLRRLTLLMSACATTVLRLIGMPRAFAAGATRWAVLSNWASVNGSGPAPKHSIDSYTHSLRFTPVAPNVLPAGKASLVAGLGSTQQRMAIGVRWHGVVASLPPPVAAF